MISRRRQLERQGSFNKEVKTASEYTQQSVKMGSLGAANAQEFALRSHHCLPAE